MRKLIAFLALVTMIVAAGAAHAQEPLTSIVVQAFDESQSSSLLSFPPNDTTPSTLGKFAPGYTVDVSPDSLWLIGYGYAEGSDTLSLYYQAVGSEPVAVQTSGGIIYAGFANQSRYVLYTTVSGSGWSVGTVSVDTGEARSYSVPEGSGQPGQILWFDEVSGLAYVLGVPAGEGSFGALYRIMIPTADSGTNEISPPEAVVSSDIPLSPDHVIVSADGSMAAYLYFDAANPPQNYQQFGPNPLFNAIGLINLNEGTTRQLAAAAAGQGIVAFDWRTANESILYASGAYQNTHYIVTPTWYTVDLAGTVTAGGQAMSDTRQQLGAMKVCDNTLFYVIFVTEFSQGAENLIASLLIGAPLDSSRPPLEVLATKSFTMVRCTIPLAL
ncbi:MAG: hypothetical protein U0528_10480 [Anaerolineae bacterium]|nr:hypothetical protein [Anaerolineae bacterium]